MSYIQRVLEDDKFEKETLKAGHLIENDLKQAAGERDSWFKPALLLLNTISFTNVISFGWSRL